MDSDLYYAVTTDNLHGLKDLWRRLSVGDQRTPTASTVLHLALHAKKHDLTKATDNYGWTVFHYVAFNDLYTIVEYLVGADKSMGYRTDDKYKRTALHVAAYKGNVRVTQKLLEYYPDCWDIVDGKGQNMLHIAVNKDRKEMIRFILLQGRKTSNALLIQRDNDGMIKTFIAGNA
ncbi:hypothetical protein POM88_000690 [Heracleum sosnowskyi]|uniref:Uncharacterized protein n=1 Tax=Heracleum sosnowskyi TaxID=360622 RepID=A0AAD8N495_9APIA|nr:hypothetical protein POM88_000690 [Heracleum sosnowskyi]